MTGAGSSARGLADRMWADGDLRTPAWFDAVVATPRHVLVPRAWQQDEPLGEPWRDAPVGWLLAALDAPGLECGHVLDDVTGVPVGAVVTSADGSRAQVRDGRVVETGPTDLWRTIERCHREWQDLDRPGWDRVGLTVDRRSQQLWVDDPGSVVRAVG